MWTSLSIFYFTEHFLKASMCTALCRVRGGGAGRTHALQEDKWGSSPSCVKSSGRQTFYTTQRFGPDNLRSSAWDYILHLIIMLSTLVIITFYNFHLLKYSTWYLAYINSSIIFYRWIDERKMEKRAESIIFWVWSVV